MYTAAMVLIIYLASLQKAEDIARASSRVTFLNCTLHTKLGSDFSYAAVN